MRVVCAVRRWCTSCTSLVQLRPENSEEFIEYLISIGNLDEAATKLAAIVNDVSARVWLLS